MQTWAGPQARSLWPLVTLGAWQELFWGPARAQDKVWESTNYPSCEEATSLVH